MQARTVQISMIAFRVGPEQALLLPSLEKGFVARDGSKFAIVFIIVFTLYSLLASADYRSLAVNTNTVR